MNQLTRVSGQRERLHRLSSWILLIILLSVIMLIEQGMRLQSSSAMLLLKEFPITTASGDQLEPALAYNEKTNTFLVAWRSASSGVNSGNIEAQLVAYENELVGEVLPIVTLSSLQRSPAVASQAASSDFIISWIDTRNSNLTDNDIYARSIRNGKLPETEKIINDGVGRVGGVAASFCPNANSYLIAWHEDEDALPKPNWTFFVFGRPVSPTGEAINDIVLATADYPDPGFQQNNPELISPPSGENLLLVFRDARYPDAGSQNNDDIFGQFVDCTGNPLEVDDFPISIQFSGAANGINRGNKQNLPAAAYNSRQDQFLVVWEDERNQIRGEEDDTYDIYGQLLSREGKPHCSSTSFNLEITNAAGDQRAAAVSYSPIAGAYLVVWEGWRDGDSDIYGRLVDEYGRRIGEEIVISEADGNQTSPKIAYHNSSGHFFIIWQDDRDQGESGSDIYGSFYLPSINQPSSESDFTLFLPLVDTLGPVWPNDSDERARCWLGGQTVRFPYPEDISGYSRDGCDEKVAHYKEDVACYTPIIGNAVVSYDYCQYGSQEEQEILGKYGRSYLYDQAVYAIALMMSGEFEEARQLLDYLSSYQNVDISINGAADGSFGFSFNTVGCSKYSPENRDSFYDANYIRNGANAWAGYAFTMYQHLTGDDRYQDVIERLAEYLLGEQIAAGEHGQGLITGGFGRYIVEDDFRFEEEDIDWVSVEHNIDAYFFFRDLGVVTGNATYSNAANEIKSAMLEFLWNDSLGRFDRGLNDDINALDAASWGAMFLLAIGEEEMAQLSLDYAERTYRNLAGDVAGYKPHVGEVDNINWDEIDLVWSEGSLGMAMAYLKLGSTTSVARAHEILAEMVKLQDSAGGLFYASHGESEPVLDFPEVPSVASSGWHIMVIRSLEDTDFFWGTDP